MHPYRTAPPLRPDSPDDAGRPRTPLEEWLIAGGLLAIGAVRVAVAVATGEAFGADVTLAALLGAIGAVLLVRAL